MNVYLIAYDLIKESVRPPIVEEIIKIGYFGGCAKLSESSYAVASSETADQIFMRLKKFIDSNDYLHVINLKAPYNGQGDPEVINWLNDKLLA